MGLIRWLVGVFVVLPLAIGGLSALVFGVTESHGGLLIGGVIAMALAYQLMDWVGD